MDFCLPLRANTSLVLFGLRHRYAELLHQNIPFTPNDNVKLYRALESGLGAEAVKHLNIQTVFPGENRRLTLDDSKEYEILLKDELIRLKSTHPDTLRELLQQFERPVETFDTDVKIFNLFRAIKQKNMTPCIVFQLNKYYCKEIFESLIVALEKLELLNYPHHYDNLEWTHEYYEGYVKRLTTFQENMKLGKMKAPTPKKSSWNAWCLGLSARSSTST